MAHQFRVNRCLQADYELDYLFADASFFKYHPGAAGEPILTTWGITTEGKKVFIAERDFELVAQEQVLDHEVVALIEQGGQGREQDAE